MTGVVLAALLITPLVGALAEHLVDEHAVLAAELAEHDQRSRAELIERGMQPLETAVARRLGAERGVELLVASSEFALPLANGVVAGSAPGEGVTLAARIVAEELSRHPRELLMRARLSRVALCSNLSEAGAPIPSLPNLNRTLLLDVDADAAFLRRLVHHELYHFLDYAADDQVQRDPSWEKLNDRYFVYGSGGRFERDPKSSLPAELPGFVTRYAMSALEEDKAETFAFWMVERDWLERRVKSDPVLAAKLSVLQSELSSPSP